MTLGQSIAETRKRLEPHYSDGEARALVREILFRLKGWTPVDIAVKADEPVSGFIQSKISEAVDRLLRDEPVQYIFRRATFYGLDFTVTPDVLIPRPETAELVDIIVGDHSGQSDLRVADLCTGSGCIACALARNLPFAEVTAIDISEPAIAVARENASQLKVDVDVRRDDVLALTPPEAPLYDIIVSNPPYITQSEKTSVDANVLLSCPTPTRCSSTKRSDSMPSKRSHPDTRYTLRSIHSTPKHFATCSPDRDGTTSICGATHQASCASP